MTSLNLTSMAPADAARLVSDALLKRTNEAKSSTPNKFSRLSTQLLLLVAEFLRVRDVGCWARTSRCVHPRLTLSLRDTPSPALAAIKVFESSPEIPLNSLLQRTFRLESLDLCNTFANELPALTVFPPSLTSLRCMTLTRHTTQLLIACTKLETLVVQAQRANCDFKESEIARWPRLRVLHIGSAAGALEASWAYILLRCAPALTELCLTDVHAFDMSWLLFVPALRSLKLRRVSPVQSRESLVALAELRHLKHLEAALADPYWMGRCSLPLSLTSLHAGGTSMPSPATLICLTSLRNVVLESDYCLETLAKTRTCVESVTVHDRRFGFGSTNDVKHLIASLTPLLQHNTPRLKGLTLRVDMNPATRSRDPERAKLWREAMQNGVDTLRQLRPEVIVKWIEADDGTQAAAEGVSDVE